MDAHQSNTEDPMPMTTPRKMVTTDPEDTITTCSCDCSQSTMNSSLEEHISLLSNISEALPELELAYNFMSDFDIEDIINENREEEFLSDKLNSELSALQSVSKGIMFETLDIRNNRLNPLLSLLSSLLKKRVNRARIADTEDHIYKLLSSLPRTDSEEPTMYAMEIIVSFLEDDRIRNRISEISISDSAVEALEKARLFPISIIVDPTLTIMEIAMRTRAGKAKLLRNGALQFLAFYSSESDRAESLLLDLLSEKELVADNAPEDIPAMLLGRTFRNKGLMALVSALTSTREKAPQRFGFKRVYL